MAICPIGPDEHAEFVAFLDAGMRPQDSPTRTAEDFPVALAGANLDGMWGLRDDRGFAAGLALLTRDFTTTAGTVSVAAIGSVVTRPDRRGEGLSRQLQNTVLDALTGSGVPLAVLWTDRPELYAGRGFTPAGWEYHLELEGCDLAGTRATRVAIRPFLPADTAAVAGLYGRHPLRTLRADADADLLYSMPGTRGIVAERDGTVVAYAFCGKGEDFPGYVAEWGGAIPDVLGVLAHVRDSGLAHRVLVPAGGEELLAATMPRGAGVAVIPCGLWAVLNPAVLSGLVDGAPGGDPRDATAWLGCPGEDGVPRPGRLQIAVWGFDSV